MPSTATPSSERAQATKLGLSIVFLTISVVYIWINIEHPTNLARNTFFYADYYVADQIVETGSIPNLVFPPHWWGKIINRTKVVAIPLFLAILKLVANVSFSASYTQIPSFLLISGSLYIIISRLDLSIVSRSLLALAGGVAIPATAYYATQANSLVKGVAFLVPALLIIDISGMIGEENSPPNLSTVVLIVPILFTIFFWHPSRFFVISGTIAFIGVLAFIRDRRQPLYLSLAAICGFILLLVFYIPLNAYILGIQKAVIGLSQFDISSPMSTGTESYPTAYSPKYYSLIPLPLIFCLSFVGGLLVLLEYREGPSPFSIVSLSWGLSVLFLSLLYLATSTSWLVGRSYILALPVMVIGSAKTISLLSNRKQNTVSILLLLLILLSFGLQLGTPEINLRVYETGIQGGADWTNKYIDEPVSTDRKIGAIIAADGGFNARYPDDYNRTRDLYYSNNTSLYRSLINRYSVLSTYMTEYGFVGGDNSYKAIDEGHFNAIVKSSDKIYSNNKTTVIKNY